MIRLTLDLTTKEIDLLLESLGLLHSAYNKTNVPDDAKNLIHKIYTEYWRRD